MDAERIRETKTHWWMYCGKTHNLKYGESPETWELQVSGIEKAVMVLFSQEWNHDAKFAYFLPEYIGTGIWTNTSADTLDGAMQEAEKAYLQILKERQELAVQDVAMFCGGDVQSVQSILDRAVPMKPAHVSENFSGNFVFECPVCGHSLQDEYNDCFHFCPDCGQAIDWEGVE